MKRQAEEAKYEQIRQQIVNQKFDFTSAKPIVRTSNRGQQSVQRVEEGFLSSRGDLVSDKQFEEIVTRTIKMN